MYGVSDVVRNIVPPWYVLYPTPTLQRLPGRDPIAVVIVTLVTRYAAMLVLIIERTVNRTVHLGWLTGWLNDLLDWLAGIDYMNQYY